MRTWLVCPGRMETSGETLGGQWLRHGSEMLGSPGRTPGRKEAGPAVLCLQFSF